MRYVLTFNPQTCSYSCHAEGCSAATSIISRKVMTRCLLDESFTDPSVARWFADNDESAKAGKPAKAPFSNL